MGTTIGFDEGNLVGWKEGFIDGEEVGTLDGKRVVVFACVDGTFECGGNGEVFDTSTDGSEVGSVLGSKLGSIVKVGVVTSWGEGNDGPCVGVFE